MEEVLRIKVASIEKLEKNMYLEIFMSGGESKGGYFKKFMVKENGKNVYRSSVAELPTNADVYLFFTDQEQDQVVQATAKTFVKSDSVSIKQIKELYILPPPTTVPMFNKLFKDVKELKSIVKQ